MIRTEEVAVRLRTVLSDTSLRSTARENIILHVKGIIGMPQRTFHQEDSRISGSPCFCNAAKARDL